MPRIAVFVLVVLNMIAATALSEQRVFIGVGIDEYDNPNVSATPYCVNDVTLIANLLGEGERATFDKKVVLRSGTKVGFDQPTKANIERELISNLRNLNEEDTVIFFFAGHGYLNSKGQGFLITKDTDPANLEDTAISTASVRRLLSATDATKVCILDCCHAGARGLVPRAKVKVATGKELGQEFAQLANVVTIASCDASQESHPIQREKQGLFTFMLAEALRNDDLDTNNDGFLEVGEIFTVVRNNVRDSAKKLLNEQQVPGLITIGELPEVELTKAIGGTKPFASNFAKEQSGLVPKDWTGSMIVRNGLLMPEEFVVGRVYSAQLPPQQMRDGFELNVVVDYISVGRHGTAPTGHLVIILTGKRGDTWRIGFKRGYVHPPQGNGRLAENGNDIDKLLGGNAQTTAKITVRRIVTDRGASLLVFVDGNQVHEQKIHDRPFSGVELQVLHNRKRTPEVHSVRIDPVRRTTSD